MPYTRDTHVPDPPCWQSPAPCGISVAQMPACACTFLGGSPVQALDLSAVCSRLAVHVSVISLAPRQYTLRRYTSPVAGTVTVRLPFGGPCAGAISHTPGLALQLVTPSPRANPGLSVAGATPSDKQIENKCASMDPRVFVSTTDRCCSPCCRNEYGPPREFDATRFFCSASGFCWVAYLSSTDDERITRMR